MHMRRGEDGMKRERMGARGGRREGWLARKERKNDRANRAGRLRLLLHLDCQYPIPSDRRLAGQPAASVLARLLLASQYCDNACRYRRRPRPWPTTTCTSMSACIHGIQHLRRGMHTHVHPSTKHQAPSIRHQARPHPMARGLPLLAFGTLDALPLHSRCHRRPRRALLTTVPFSRPLPLPSHTLHSSHANSGSSPPTLR